MLMQALCRYYDLLAAHGRVVEDGYSAVRIHYRVALTPEGAVDGIEAWMVPVEKAGPKGKTKVVLAPRPVTMFRRTEKPGIEANYVEHRPTYLFGLNREKDGTLNPADRTDKAVKSHRAFVERNLAFTDGVDSPVVNAFRRFLQGWAPADERLNQHLLGLGKEYPTAGYVFCLAGRPDVMLQDDPGLQARWRTMLEADAGDATDAVTGQCAVTGRTAEIARLHDKINGIAGGLATGTKLVSYKNDSETSYGVMQSLNSNVSVEAMRKYTRALNVLADGRTHKTMLGDVTVLRFAISPDSRCDALAAGALFGDFSVEPSGGLDAGETEKLLQRVFTDVVQGVANAGRILREQEIDPEVDYYIVGLKPNSSRLAVQFIYRKRLGELVGNAAQHQADLATSADARPIALWQIANQLVSPKAKEQKVDPALTAKLLEAVVYGYRYPAFLLATAVRRIRTDSDDETNKFIKFNPVRAGILKACLNRDARRAGRKEEIGMALDKGNENPAYLCGRLFAVLERVQEMANPGINRTITDAYFASASARPALIFPRLVKLAQTHLKKLEYARYWNRQIGDIMTMLNHEYPDTLSLADQGRFDIGYYQQKYAPGEKKQDTRENEEEEQ